jgi:hypothetical protein
MMDHHPYSQDIGKSSICGFLDIRLGGPFACFIWIVNSIHDCTYMLFLTCFLSSAYQYVWLRTFIPRKKP